MTFFWQNPVLQTNPRMSSVRNIDQLAVMFGLPSWEDVEELNQEHIWEMSAGGGESAELEAQREVYSKWHGAVLSAAESLFGEHDLELTPKKDDPSYEFNISPTISWDDSARKIVQTVNGVGEFHFSSLREFLDSGPYTARQAVLSHLGYINRYPDVYGTTSAQRLYESAWR